LEAGGFVGNLFLLEGEIWLFRSDLRLRDQGKLEEIAP